MPLGGKQNGMVFRGHSTEGGGGGIWGGGGGGGAVFGGGGGGGGVTVYTSRQSVLKQSFNAQTFYLSTCSRITVSESEFSVCRNFVSTFF